MANWTAEKMGIYLAGASPKAIGLAVLRIYERQTADEQKSKETRHTNSMGFSGADAKTGTYLAQWVLSGRTLDGRFLDKGRKIAIRYRAQLAEIANGGASRRADIMRQVDELLAAHA